MDGFDQGQTHLRQHQLEGNSRETRAGADVNQAAGCVAKVQRHQAGQRIEEMLGLDTLFVADSGQIEAAVPLHQLFFKQLKRGDLLAAELQPQELARVLRKSFHRRDYILKGTDAEWNC